MAFRNLVRSAQARSMVVSMLLTCALQPLPTSPVAAQSPDVQTLLVQQVSAIMPSMPLYGASDANKRPAPCTTSVSAQCTTSLSVRYAVADNAAKGVIPGPDGSRSFSVSWEIKPVFGVPRTADEVMQEWQSQARSKPCGNNAQAGPGGEFSCKANDAVPGAIDINFSGDPYMASGTIFAVRPCANVWAQVGMSLFAVPSHGARNKPNVIAGMKAAASSQIDQVAPGLLAAVDKACAAAQPQAGPDASTSCGVGSSEVTNLARNAAPAAQPVPAPQAAPNIEPVPVDAQPAPVQPLPIDPSPASSRFTQWLQAATVSTEAATLVYRAAAASQQQPPPPPVQPPRPVPPSVPPLADPPFVDALGPWSNLISFRPPVDVQYRLQARSIQVQYIDQAVGSNLSIDYFPVRITKLPTVNGKQLTAEELLTYTRLHIGDFIDPAISTGYVPYDDGIDGPRWRCGDPVGTAIHIKVYDPWFGVNVDDLTVVTGESAPDHFIFSTAWSPGDHGHPLGGNRQWGFTRESDGSTTFYTRGADRTWQLFDALNETQVYAGQFRNWTSFIQGLATFVNQHGGMAQIQSPTSARYSWTDLGIDYFDPSVPEAQPLPPPPVPMPVPVPASAPAGGSGPSSDVSDGAAPAPVLEP